MVELDLADTSYHTNGIFNSRGVYTVDPNGMQEKELADRFHKQAFSIRNEGYHRFAATLGEISERYCKEASRVIDEFKKDDDA